MFRSVRRDVVFPQAEHARLAGTLALVWGNAAFARPELPFRAWVEGVTLHDRGYGLHDDDGIGDVPRHRWLAIQQAGFEPRGEDPVVDLVVALHVRRLVGEGPEGAAMEAALPGLAAAAGVSLEAARRADRVTNLCDRVAFDLCEEAPAGGSVAVPPGPDAELVEIAYVVDGHGAVTLDPWPLRVARVEGLLLGFRGTGYPARLDPAVVPFAVRPA